jgi:RND family efflux transporter MFP subunit
MPDDTDILRHTPPSWLKTAGIAAACVAAIIVAIGLISRLHADQNVKNWTQAQAIPTVKVIDLSSEGAQGALVLPGDVQAFNSAPIYARVSGYLKRWYVDIGTPVKAGQLLAEIDIPDQDQQLAQAKADLATAVANERLSAITAKRWNELLKENAVAAQDVDEKNGDLAAKTAATASARANVDRLEALESFKSITAPFAGVVTSRSTDVGALITVGLPTETPLFTVSDQSRLRIYVRAPQIYSAEIKPGMPATFTVPDYPSRSFNATVAATADAVDTQTGTQLVQLLVDNVGNVLKPGDYAQVHFALSARSNVIHVPASALMFRDSGMSVATISPNGRVAIKPIAISRDFGTAVEIASGLSLADRVIDNPPDSLRQGDAVRIAGRNGTAVKN